MPLLLLVILNIITPGSAGTVPGVGCAQVLTPAIGAFCGVAPRVLCAQVKWK